MPKVEPFLLKYKKETTTQTDILETAMYDQTVDMTMVCQDGLKVAAIDTYYRLTTKKADMETGEDQKDSLI